MRILFAILIASLALVSGAKAEVYNWTGYYIGANAGYGWGDSDVSTTTSAGTYFAPSSVTAVNAAGHGKVHPDGFVGGVQAGMNWQNGNLVLGGEVDFDAYDLSKSRTVTAIYPAFSPDTFTLGQSVKADWLLTLRPRVGVAMDNLLGYVTGGLAVTNLKNSNSFSDTLGLGAAEYASGSKTKYGWTLGAGVEYALMDKWSAKLEYLYTDFGSVSSSGTLTAAGPSAAPFSHSADLTSSTLRLGVNYKF